MEEYDEIYAAYADAKSKPNRMRTSRGSTRSASLHLEAVGKERSPEASGQEKKGGKQLPVAKGGSKAAARGKTTVGRQVCLRCG